MDDEMLLLEVPFADREAFLLCLILGTLEAIRRGVWPLDSGIWTLGRPYFFQSLCTAAISSDLIEELQTIDELAALAKLTDRQAADARLDQMIGAVRTRLSSLEEPSWSAHPKNIHL